MSCKRFVRISGMIVAALILGALARSAWALDVEGHNLNVLCNRPHLDGQWFGMRYASDGNCYFGSSDHCAHEGAAFLKYDPRTHEPTLLQYDITNLTGDDPTVFPQGKLHSDIVEANGWVYWATHFSNDQIPGGDTAYHGSHLQGYCLATGEFRDYGVLCVNCTCYCGITVDVARNRAYVFACPITSVGFAVAGGSHVYAFDLASGVKTDLGILAPHMYDTMFGFFLDKRGDVWFDMAGDNGMLRVIRGSTLTMETYPNVLPPLYRWDSDTLDSNQASRWIDWMQPLADGDRAVFHEGFYGGRIYIFDSTKDITSGAAFSSPAHIGPSDSGMALSGNKLFYIQRPNRQQGWQQYHDFHMMSVNLNPAVTPQIVDYGLIQDQIGRLPWRLPSLMTDGAGTLFMTGDWWTDWLQPGIDDGTYRYMWVDSHVPKEYYDKLPRGEEFARADLPDILSDNFDDNVMGSIWHLAEQDHNHVWASEANERLEIHSTADSAPHTAAYKSVCTLTASRDFACRVDYHVGDTSADGHSLGLKIAKDASNEIGIYAASGSGAGPTWIVKGLTGGMPFASNAVTRTVDDGTLYISYDSLTDKLYLSKTAYWWRENTANGSWMYAGLLKGGWSATDVQFSLEGIVQNAVLNGGTEYFDNFVLDDAGDCTLTVIGNPETHIAIDVDTADTQSQQNGETCFSRDYIVNTTVTLAAPATTPHGDHSHNFIRWNVNDQPQTPGQMFAPVTLVDDASAVAVYETATWTLAMRSSPVSGAPISSSPEGVTPYDVQVNDGVGLTLTAPSAFTVAGKTWYFVNWALNGVAQAGGVRSVAVTPLTDVTAVANYRQVQALRVSGHASVYGGTTIKYKCVAYFTSGSSKVVTASGRWTDNVSCAKFIRPGTLQTKRVTKNVRCVVTAKYGGYSKRFITTIRRH